MKVEDPTNCIAGTADLLDVLLKYGLATNEDVRSIVEALAPDIKNFSIYKEVNHG